MLPLDRLLSRYLSTSIRGVATHGLSHRVHVARFLVWVDLVSAQFLWLFRFSLSLRSLYSGPAINQRGMDTDQPAMAVDLAKEAYPMVHRMLHNQSTR
jgi:hypothetical protein